MNHEVYITLPNLDPHCPQKPLDQHWYLVRFTTLSQDDQDLVQCFVDKGGLDTLVGVGEEADHNYIIYIIRGTNTKRNVL